MHLISLSVKCSKWDFFIRTQYGSFRIQLGCFSRERLEEQFLICENQKGIRKKAIIMKYPKGSEWRKWDLHVHTPSSMVEYYSGTSPEEKWEGFISDLENLPPEFKVLGINDYLFIDGYEKVLEYKSIGRLKNIDAIFPVIEFRVKKFAGNKLFKRVNFHVIFSDIVPPEIIKQQFLNQLYGKYVLEPGLEGINWQGYITKESLKDLGKAIKATLPEEKVGDYGADLEEGFNNINFDEDEIIKILNTGNTYLKGNYLTAVGKTEWDALAWNDNSIAEKKTVINNADFVFTSSENLDAFYNAKKKLEEQKVNSLLLDCSDAHRNSNSANKDRIGKCFTWIKADPTFEGLKQVLHEADRICVAGRPELIERVITSPNKFIASILIKRIDNCQMSELWYDNISIPLNPSLVAIIGNKGNGKSALTDIIGLVGNSHVDSYSFLTKKKFRNPRPYNRAANIEAKIEWQDKTHDGYLRLDANIDTNKIEKVKYIPQNFLELLCVNEDERDFESEIKKIIFAHTDDSEKLGFSSLDELIAYKSEVVNKDLGTIKGEIDDLNQKIILLERKSSDSYKQGLRDNLHGKQKELENHLLVKPEIVQEPQNNPELERRNQDINTQISTLKDDINLKNERRGVLLSDKAKISLDIAELEKSQQTFQTLESNIKTAIENQRPILEKYQIDVLNIISYKIDLTLISGLISANRKKIDDINIELNGTTDTPGLIKLLDASGEKLKTLEEKLDEPYRLYQQYLKSYDDWNTRHKSIKGDKYTFGTIEYFEDQIDYVENRLGNDLAKDFALRRDLVKKLYAKKSEINQLYSNSYKPISNFINQYGHLMKDYKINLSVEFTLDGFTQKFFDHVSQGAKGTYIGIEEGNKYLSDLTANFNFNEIENLLSFLDELRDSLHHDRRQDLDRIRRDVETQLKKGYSVEDLYRFIYNLDFLKPTFRLNLGTKSLSELSPGERGALLLIFYLFLDNDDKPLIIDQPEENLDNQSVYNYLVHFIKEAKKRRQIIIVTHNPNLAVVCDAEQVIHMTIDKGNNNAVSFDAGSIEAPAINKTIVDILEGTKPAFNNRTNKYSLIAQ